MGRHRSGAGIIVNCYEIDSHLINIHEGYMPIFLKVTWLDRVLTSA